MTKLAREALAADIAQALDLPVEDIGGDDNLIDLGLDSMRAMMLLQQWNDRGLDLDFSDFAKAPTIDGWWSVVERHQASRHG